MWLRGWAGCFLLSPFVGYRGNRNRLSDIAIFKAAEITGGLPGAFRELGWAGCLCRRGNHSADSANSPIGVVNQRVSWFQAHDIRVVRQGTPSLIGCWRPYISARAFLTVGRALINPPDSLLSAIATEKSQNGGRPL